MSSKSASAIFIVLLMLFGGLFVGMGHINLMPANTNHYASRGTSVIPKAYATSFGSSSPSMKQVEVKDTITVNPFNRPIGVAFDSSNGYVYVTNDGSNSVSVINGSTNTAIKTIGVGLSPHAAAFDSSNGYVYVVNSAALDIGTGSVSVINGSTNTVIKTIGVGRYPDGIAFDSSNGYVYVTNFNSNNVSVINGSTNTVIRNIGIGSHPQGAAFDSSNGYIYVTNSCSNNVSVINGATNTVIKNIGVGSTPYGAAFDSSNGYIYVTNSGSSNVSVINDATNTVIKNIGVGSCPQGAAFDSSNGYVYISSVSGTVSVLGYFTSSTKYSITFTESGLPYGTTWYVNLSNGQTFSGTGASITFSEPNGTYSYTIATVNKSLSSSGGSFTVNGNPVSQPVTFTEVYKVTFTESGLPSATTWYVNITGQALSSPITGTSYSISLPNDSYSYTVQTSNKIYEPSYTNSFTVNGKALPEAVIFSEVTYKVTFTESGLPYGTTWYANLSNGQTFSGTGASITFSEPNGTYSYSIATVNKSWSSTGGSFTVNGKALPEAVTFSEVTYKVTFTESGLPTGSTWYVNITGQASSGQITGTSYSASLSNGSYSYTISTTNKQYKASPSNGSFAVAGSSKSISITFTHTSTPSSPFNLYDIIGGVVAVIIIASVSIILIKRKKG